MYSNRTMLTSLSEEKGVSLKADPLSFCCCTYWLFLFLPNVPIFTHNMIKASRAGILPFYLLYVKWIGYAFRKISPFVVLYYVKQEAQLSHSIVFPCQTGWRYSNWNPPNGGVECRWGRQKSRFCANIR